MTYKWHPEKLMKTDRPEDWACHCAYLADSLIRTAQMAIDNDGDGSCSAESRISSASYTLEVAQAFMAVVIEGIPELSRRPTKDVA